MKLLEDRVIIVTGGGRGLGRSQALACAAAGARVLVNDLGCARDGTGADPEVACEVVREIRERGGTAEASTLDVASRGSETTLVEQARSAFGRIDGLVCSAGVDRDGAFMHAEPDEQHALADLHLLAPMRLAQAVARDMHAHKRAGSIVLTTGPEALFGVRNQATTCAAGAGIVGFTRALAIELKRRAVRVNAIAPTARTRLTQALPMFANIRPSSMTPEQVAPLVTFLLSDLAAHVSGEVLGAAGGRFYTLRVAETPGAFLEGDALSAEGVAAAWNDIVRERR